MEKWWFFFRTQPWVGKAEEWTATLGLGLAEIISTLPYSMNRVVIRTGLETMVAISQADREKSKHPPQQLSY